jgi:hypothetical protein
MPTTYYDFHFSPPKLVRQPFKSSIEKFGPITTPSNPV